MATSTSAGGDSTGRLPSDAGRAVPDGCRAGTGSGERPVVIGPPRGWHGGYVPDKCPSGSLGNRAVTLLRESVRPCLRNTDVGTRTAARAAAWFTGGGAGEQCRAPSDWMVLGWQGVEPVNREHLTAMAEATALTRAGRLAEATALIQRTLAGDGPPRVVPGTIVVDEERLHDHGPPEPRPPDPARMRRVRDAAAGFAICCASGSPGPPTAYGATCRRPPSSRAAGDHGGLGDLRDLLGAPQSQASPGPGRRFRRSRARRCSASTGRGRRPAVHPLRPDHRHGPASADRDAARRHADRRRLRRRHADERARRGARGARRLPRAGHVRQRDAVLELVRARRPAPRRR